jgi:HAD superfamily hydrolase (TIGR01509 family)
MRYPHLIFDLDDTLIDSFSQYVAVHQRVAAELEMRVPSRDELIVYLDTWERTLERLWPDADLAPFVARYHTLTHEHPYPAIAGAREALPQLRERGHRLWVVTKRSRRLLSLRMRQAELDAALFDGIFALEDQPAPKPDPRCFAPVWRALGGPRPEQSLYIGDRVEDERAASAAGVSFVAVGTGPEGLAAFAHVPSSHHLTSAAQLPHWLEGT